MTNIYKYKEFTPKISETSYIAPTAVVIGDVDLAEDSNIWFQSVLRGDVNHIRVGRGTNIQDLSMLHVTEKDPLIIGDHVTVGHSVILHACTIENGCLIGMGAKVLDGAVIGEKSLVAAGSVVPPGKVYPKNSFIMGIPAKRMRALTEAEIAEYSEHYSTYVTLAKSYRKDFSPLS